MKWSDKDAKIIYSDNHLVIAQKPAGMLTQPDSTERESLEEFVKDWIKKEYQKPGAVFLHCIHRLDRVASGLVLFARTSKALSRLNEASRSGQIERFYTAEVEGILPQKLGTLTHWLIHSEHEALVVKGPEQGAKEAILHYKVLEENERESLLLIELKTGRYHQIRAQFGAIGHPLIGDVRYGAKKRSEPGIHLMCSQIAFFHPVTKERTKFSL